MLDTRGHDLTPGMVEPSDKEGFEWTDTLLAFLQDRAKRQASMVDIATIDEKASPLGHMRAGKRINVAPHTSESRHEQAER